MTQQRPVSRRRTNVYPSIRTNRIYISQTSRATLRIKIDYSLNLIRPGFDAAQGGRDVLSEFLNERRSNNSVNVSFMVLDERNESLITDLLNGSRQSTTMMNQAGDERFATLNDAGGWVKVPLRDIFLESADRQLYTTATDIGGETYYETYNTVEIEYSMESLEQELQSQSIFYSPSTEQGNFNFSETYLQKLHLIAFLEMPYEEFSENVSTPEQLRTIPITETIYDRLLEPASGGALRPPATRNIFYVNDSNYPEIDQRPYSGPSFYDEGSSPPGWFSGTPGSTLLGSGRGPRLSVRVVPNTKVTVDAAPLDDFSIHPSIGQRPFPEVGQGLEQYLLSTTDTSTFLSHSQLIEEMIKNSLTSMSRKTQSFIEPWSYRHTWITRSDDSEELNSHYNCIFGIKYFDLIKDNTPFGTLLDFHLQNISDPQSRTLVNEFYEKSKILHMKIIRRRLSYDPYGHNDQDSPVHLDFQENQQNQIILQTQDNPGRAGLGILEQGNERASIEEVELSLEGDSFENTIVQQTQAEINSETFEINPDKLTRSFLIKDYELFYNLGCGKFTYDVEIFFLDAARSIIEKRYSDLVEQIYRTENVIKRFSAPVIRKPRGEIEQGNYDYNLRRFFNVSADIVEDYKRNLSQLLDKINQALYLLTGVSPFQGDTNDPETFIAQLMNRLDPSRTTTRIEDIEFFINQSKNLAASLDKVIVQSFLKEKNPIQFHTGEVHVPNSSAQNSSIIHLKIKTGIIHDASETTKLVSDYGLGDGIDFSRFLERARMQGAADVLRDRADTDYGGGIELPQSGDLPEGPSPYDVLLPETGPEINFNPEYMEPLEFIQIPIPLLAVGTELRKPIPRDILRGVTIPMETNPQRRTSHSPNRQIVANEPFSTGKEIIRITKRDFLTCNPIQRSIKETKILVCMQADSHTSGVAFKDSSYDARYISTGLGKVDMSFGGTDITSGPQAAAEMSLRYLSIESTLLSDDSKSAIIDDLIDSNDKDEFTKRIELNYDYLSETRDTLGEMYDFFNKVAAIGSLFSEANLYKKDSETRFKFGIDKDTSKTMVELSKDPFQAKKAEFVTFDKNGNTVYQKTKAVRNMKSFIKRTNKEPTGKLRKVKLFKLSPLREKDNIASMNDAMLLERF